MECLWRLFRHWRPDGNCDQQDPAVFYVCNPSYDGFSHHSLYGAGFLEKYPEVYESREAKSLVLFIRNPKDRKLEPGYYFYYNDWLFRSPCLPDFRTYITIFLLSMLLTLNQTLSPSSIIANINLLKSVPEKTL